jgi:magnesium transporter
MSAVRALIFRGGNVIEHVALDASVPQHEESAYIWVDAVNPGAADLAVLQERFGLRIAAVEPSMSAAQIPKVDVDGDQVLAVLKIARLKNDAIEYADIDVFVSRRYIVTLRRENDPELVNAQEGFRSGLRSARPGPDFILHAIAEFVVDNYFPVVQMIEDEVLSMEHRLLDAFLRRDETTRLFSLRREAIQLQHVLTRMSDVLGKLSTLEVPCIGPDVRPYFRNVHDQLSRLDGMIRGLIDVIRAVFEASNLLEQQRQGVITRQLASWAAILGAPTAIGALIPELQTPYGYAIVLAFMASVCLALYIRFKRLRWL